MSVNSHRERIISCAMEMFVTQGIKSVRMDDIASQLGVSKRTLYEMFGDKEELLYLCMSRYVQVEAEHYSRLAKQGKNVLDSLFIVLSYIVDESVVSTRLMNNLHKFYPNVCEKIAAESYDKRTASMRNMINLGKEQGLFVDRFNPDFAINILWHLASMASEYRNTQLPTGMDEQMALMYTICIFFRGISTAKGMALVDEYMEKRNNKY